MATPSVESIPLEDELGDVLEKAMRREGMSAAELEARSRVPVARINEAIDYYPGLTCEELSRLAAALGLNEVGLCALGAGKYPLPETGGLPFRLWPLRIPHGIGVANAYIVAEAGADRGILFDTGEGLAALELVWPEEIGRLDAVFLTHVEAEHAGGLCAVVARFSAAAAYVPSGARAPCGMPCGEGGEYSFGDLVVRSFSTPGHASAHNCYCVHSREAPGGRNLLISGDLIFAGSAGGGYFSQRQQQEQIGRILGAVPADTVMAPGHGPLTTVENEMRFNPFVV